MYSVWLHKRYRTQKFSIIVNWALINYFRKVDHAAYKHWKQEQCKTFPIEHILEKTCCEAIYEGNTVILHYLWGCVFPNASISKGRNIAESLRLLWSMEKHYSNGKLAEQEKRSQQISSHPPCRLHVTLVSRGQTSVLSYIDQLG